MPETALPDLRTATAAEVAAAIAAGHLSAARACEAAIERIEQLDRAINAVVVRDFERAREQARERDARLANGVRGALLGVPMTVKESLDVAGLPTTWGLPHLRDVRPTADAAVVERLKAAGAVILGKTNVPPALADWQATNPIYGRTVNPHDPARSPGGSSGGAAAAVAAGMVPIEIGSDIGGSIRVPATFCGVWGHKPTYGLVPARGHGFPGTDGAPVELAVVGPLARSAADLALVLEVIAGPDGDAAAAGARALLPPPRPQRLGECRILALDRHPRVDTDAVLRAAVETVGGRAAAAGARVLRAHPLLPDLQAANADYIEMLGPIVSRGVPGAPPPMPVTRWFELLDTRHRLRRQWRALFADIDVVLAPAFGTLAYPHVDEPDMRTSTLVIDGEPTTYGRQVAWPAVATFPGLPATAVPVGRSREGLPIGLQVIGAFGQDRTTIAVGGWLAALAQA
jgi:amidase